jgi:TPR repeat protein
MDWLLGYMYATAQGVSVDYTEAYKWFILAASSNISDKDTHDRRVENRDQIAAKMTPSQLAEAQKRARDWKPEWERNLK